jgi:hypothetical protein
MADLSFLNNVGKAREELRFKPNGEIETVLGNWVEERIEEAKRRLREADRSSSQTLEQSIQPLPAEQLDSSYIVKIMAEDYYDFVNKGVNGVQRQFGSPYSFRTLGVGTAMRQAFGEFIKRRNIKQLTWVNPEGDRVTKILSTASDYRGASYVLARATKRKGIKPSFFMDETFSQDNIDELAKDLGRAVTQIFE